MQEAEVTGKCRIRQLHTFAVGEDCVILIGFLQQRRTVVDS